MKFFCDGESGARFSPCRRYRYALWRRWIDSRLTAVDGSEDRGPNFRQMVAFVGLNPSTADETKNDPTVTRCIQFARRWGYHGMAMLNLFAFRATDPAEMKQQRDPVGPENDACLRQAMELFGLVVVCWGNHGSHLGRSSKVWDGVLDPNRVYHLGVNASGEPKHPLYLKANTELAYWEGMRVS